MVHKCLAPALVLLTILAAGCGHQSAPAASAVPVSPGPASPETTVALTADCAGESVRVLGLPAGGGATGTHLDQAPYAQLRAIGGNGQPLLNLQDDGGYRTASFVRAGAPTALLLVSAGAGEGDRLQAYRCTDGPQRLQPVGWDGRPMLPARLLAATDTEIRVALPDRFSHDLDVLFRYEEGQLISHIPKDVRERLTRVIPVEPAPGLRATVHTLPEGEQPLQGGPLLITAADGRTLLERSAGVLAFVGLRQAGAPQPLLVIEIAGGGSMGMYYEAYRYDSAQARLMRVPWDGQSFTVSSQGVEQAGDGLRTGGRSEAAVGRRMVNILWQYRDGALQRSHMDFTPSPYPKDELDVLLLAFDTVSKHLPDETPRYFADPDKARQFYADLVGRLPQDGFPYCVECGYQHLPAQGPVFIWAPDTRMSLPPSRLFAVTPRFQTGPLGPQITTLTTTPVTLTVPDAAAAVQLLQQQPELQQHRIPEPDFQGGFWDVQVSGAGRWRINPRTGEVQHNQ